MDTKETKEVIDATKSIAIRIAKGLANDGVFTLAERIGFINELSGLFAAFSGIGKIPAELQDLTSAEMIDIKAHIIAGLREAGITERTNDIADWTLDMIYYNVQYVLKVKNAPPMAEKVAD